MNRSHWGGGRQSGHFAVAVALLLASYSGGCALLSPSDEEAYVLVRVNTESVPATVYRLQSPDDDQVNEYRVLSGRLSLTADGRWKSIDESETVVNGIVSRSRSEMTGRYERDGDALVLFHSGPGFNPGDSWTAELRSEGQHLVGAHTAGFLREWERR